MRGLQLTAGTPALAEFLEEWKRGWGDGLTDEVRESNRQVMQMQLVMLIASGGTTTGKKPPSKEA